MLRLVMHDDMGIGAEWTYYKVAKIVNIIPDRGLCIKVGKHGVKCATRMQHSKLSVCAIGHVIRMSCVIILESGCNVGSDWCDHIMLQEWVRLIHILSL